MPRDFFHVYHERVELDDEGEELADKHAAWEEATVTAGQILQGLDGKLKPDQEWRMEVVDEFQNPLCVLHINAEKPNINAESEIRPLRRASTIIVTSSSSDKP